MNPQDSLQEFNETLRAIIQASPLAIISLDPNGIVRMWNSAAESIFGFTEKEAIGNFLPIVPENSIEEFRLLRERVLRGEGFTGVETKRRRKDGTLISVNISTAPLRDKEGQIVGILGILADITERKAVDEALKMAKEHFRALVESSPDCISRISLSGRVISMNTNGILLNGFERPEEVVAAHCADLVVENRQGLEEAVKRAARGEATQAQYKSITKKGKEIWWDAKLTPIKNPGGVICGVTRIARDITEQKVAQEKQLIITLGMRAIVEIADELIACRNEDALFKLAVEFCRNELKLERCAIFVEQDSRMKGTYGTDRNGRTTDEHAQAFPRNHIWLERSRMLKPKDSKWFVVEEPLLEWDGEKTVEIGTGWIAITPIQSAHQPIGVFVNDTAFSGKPLDTVKQEVVAVFCSLLGDVIERKRAEEKLAVLNRQLLKSNTKLKHLALRDSHTGLFNHRYLGEVIEAEFDRAKRSAYSFSVIMLDIDYFKSINDVYGHQFGDLVLKQLSAQLKKIMRKYDIIGRFGGEEFLVVSPGIDKERALVLAHRILDAINLYNFGNKKHIVKLKISISVVSYPEDKAVKSTELIELVDQILNKVKEYGGNRVYSSSDIKKLRRPPEKSKEKDIDVGYLKEKLERLNKRANQSLIEAVFAFAKTLKLKDNYTGDHSEMTVQYATELVRILDLPKGEALLVRQAAILHDLGKIGISEKILLKKGSLTRKEFNEIKKHPEIGVDIIRPIHSLHGIIPLMLYHHERWDGKGYPNGLKGEQIPVGARIVAVADTYQALTSDRPYRKAYSQDEAAQIIGKSSGTQFDPKIADAFLNILKKEK